MSAPGDAEFSEITHRITADIPKADFEFLRSLAAYRNTLAKITKRRLPKSWAAKLVAEGYLRDHIAQQRAALKEMFDACGPIPDPKDTKAMERYVQKVLAWDAKQK